MIPLRDILPAAQRARSTPIVNWLLISANVAAFAYELALGPRLDAVLGAWAFVPGLHAGGRDLPGALATATTAMFLHGGWAHLIGNMLFLWIFGDNVEDRLGHARYLLFYLFCGLFATAAQAAAQPASMVPTIGASGAISGVLGAYVLMYPRARVVTAVVLLIFVRIVELPALLYLPLWFASQVFSGLASLHAGGATGGVAWFAHVGGFVAGPLAALLLGGFRRPATR